MGAVADQVVEDLLHLIPIEFQERDVVVKINSDGNAAVCDLGPNEIERFFEQIVQVRSFQLRTRRTNRIEKFFDNEIDYIFRMESVLK